MNAEYTQMSDKITTASTYAASAGAVLFGLSVNEFAAVAGIVIATLTFFLNAWFKWKHLELAREKRKLGNMRKEEDSGDIELD